MISEALWPHMMAMILYMFITLYDGTLITVYVFYRISYDVYMILYVLHMTFI